MSTLQRNDGGDEQSLEDVEKLSRTLEDWFERGGGERLEGDNGDERRSSDQRLSSPSSISTSSSFSIWSISMSSSSSICSEHYLGQRLLLAQLGNSLPFERAKILVVGPLVLLSQMFEPGGEV